MTESGIIVLPSDPWDDYAITANDLNETKDCPICYCDFEEGENVAKLNCGHIFHKNCIILWFDKKISAPECPICRRNMYENQPESRQNEIQINYDQIPNQNEDDIDIFSNQNHSNNKSTRKQANNSCCCILI